MAETKTKGLGRGFDSLLPGNFDKSILVDESERVQKLAIDDIEPNKAQPRTNFDKEALDELSTSIKRFGLLQPIVVTPAEAGKYKIIAGERRFRASKQAGLKQLPALVRTSKELEQLEIALVENVQRVDLSPLEQAKSIQRLHEQFNLAYEVIAKRLGKAPTTVINIARLLGLSTKVQEALKTKQISEGHARAILALKSEDKQNELLELIIRNSWSVRQAEQYASAQKKTKSIKSALNKVSATTPQTEKLGQKLNASVSLRRLAKGGYLQIAYKNDAHLDKLIKKLLN